MATNYNSYYIYGESYQYEFLIVQSGGLTGWLRGEMSSTGNWIYKLASDELLGKTFSSVYTLDHTETVMPATSTAATRLTTVRQEFNDDASLADFSDVRNTAEIVGIENLIDFLDLEEINLSDIPDYAGLVFANEGPFVTYKNNISPSGSTSDRQYFISSHGGRTPEGWLAHDELGGNVIDLGSWYFDRQILAKISILNLVEVNSLNLVNANFSISENSPVGKYVGELNVTSSDSSRLKFSITDGNTDVDKDGKSAFYINPNSGAISVNDADDLNFEERKVFNLDIKVSDGTTSTNGKAVFNLINVNEAPTGNLTISGKATEGSTLVAVSTLKEPDGINASSSKMQWLRDGEIITGANSSSYTLKATDIGRSIAVRFTYTDNGGFVESVKSAPVTPNPSKQDPGVTITGIDKTTGENGDGAIFSVRLNSALVSEVVNINFSISDATEAKLRTSKLTFTKDNWNVAQTITIIGIDDFDDDGDVAYSLNGKIETKEAAYVRVKVASVSLINKDDILDKPLVLNGSDNVDYLTGGNGDDRLYGGSDIDDLRGGRGGDRLYGENDDDFLYGEDGNDWLYGGYDDDLLYGGNGEDELYGEAGADRLEGGAGNDYLDGGTGADTLIGGAGNDLYLIDNAGDVVDDQGASTDEDMVMVIATISYKLAANLENAELKDTSGAASLTGNTLNNDLTGNGSNNSLDGGSGADLLDGGAGKDNLLGGDGTDILIGGMGNDTLNGGAGDDLADYTDAAAGFVNVNLSTGKAIGDGADTLTSIEDVIGSEGDDIFIGSAVGNEFTGGLGADQMSLGSDKAVDLLIYRAVSESIAAERDRISQFMSQQDRISLSGIDANSKVAGDQAFAFSGTAAKANALWYRQVDVDGDKKINDLIVYADVNGDAKADFEIGLVGVVKIVQADFVL